MRLKINQPVRHFVWREVVLHVHIPLEDLVTGDVWSKVTARYPDFGRRDLPGSSDRSHFQGSERFDEIIPDQIFRLVRA